MECSELANELARYDQHRVRLESCHSFNEWLHKLKGFTVLGPRIAPITPARPLARWQMLIISGVIGLIIILNLQTRISPSWGSALFYALPLTLLILFFVPERLYGSTIELVEAKTLRIVETLESILLSDQMEFSEAAYFQVKEHLATARTELRQQIDLAHRRF